jgi:hypothetical protein
MAASGGQWRLKVVSTQPSSIKERDHAYIRFADYCGELIRCGNEGLSTGLWLRARCG